MACGVTTTRGDGYGRDSRPAYDGRDPRRLRCVPDRRALQQQDPDAAELYGPGRTPGDEAHARLPGRASREGTSGLRVGDSHDRAVLAVVRALGGVRQGQGRSAYGGLAQVLAACGQE